jgi:hypothetical protein
MIDTTLDRDSKIMMPLQFFRLWNSPSFGKLFSRPITTLAGHLLCSRISCTISRTSAKVSSLNTKAFQNSGCSSEYPGDRFDLALRIAAIISSSVGTAAKSSRTGRCGISSTAARPIVDGASYTLAKCSCTVLALFSIDGIEPSNLRSSDPTTAEARETQTER